MITATDIDTRYEKVLSMFIEHQYIQDLYSEFDELRVRRNCVSDPSEIVHAMLYGPSGVGKTTFVNAYIKNSLKKRDVTQGSVPVISIELPVPLNPGNLMDSILKAVGAIQVKRERVDEKKNRVVHHLRGLNTEMLFIDEFQNVVNKGNSREFMDIIKHLANISNVVIVCVGNPDIKALRNIDDQYRRRFKMIKLPEFEECNDMFINLLWNIEKRMGLNKESRLYDVETGIPQWLFEVSEGRMGYLKRHLEDAFYKAITTKDAAGNIKELIDKELLIETFPNLNYQEVR